MSFSPCGTHGTANDWVGVNEMNACDDVIATGRPTNRARRGAGRTTNPPRSKHRRAPIISNPSSIINPNAFTLIELLVVISILVMLIALLFPVLRRARNQAKATVCQAKLRQWGLVFKLYTDDNDGRWFHSQTFNPITGRAAGPSWLHATFHLWSEPATALCPMSTIPRWPPDKFHAWDGVLLGHNAEGAAVRGAVSYGFNDSACWPDDVEPYWTLTRREYYWGQCDVRGAARIPVLYDCVLDSPFGSPYWGPPVVDAWEGYNDSGYFMVMDRHEGGINMLFMDWSVRKVGLKELWMLKWYPAFDTSGPWTRAGGVQPEDWPAWMRKFKDY